MSITLDTITHAVNSFNDIPDVTFNSIDIGEFANDVEIYTNTPAVMIPSKLNAMAGSMKTWLNSNIAAPLEAQQNTFKTEVVVRTNEAMTAVETYINNEVKSFVNDIFVPWANNSGVLLADNANTLEGNVTTTLSQLTTDYTIHVASQDAIIAQALQDFEDNLAQYTGDSGAGYSIHQTNQLIADQTMTKEIDITNYKFDENENVTYFKEGDFETHHIVYDAEEQIISYGETLSISGEARPFVNHQILGYDDTGLKTSIEQLKSYNFFINTDAGSIKSFRATGHEKNGDAAADLTILNNTSIADIDNPALTLTRGTPVVMTFEGIIPGDFVSIEDGSGNSYDNGVIGQYAMDSDTIIFKPYTSYCHDGVSAATGWGVTSDMGASEIDGDASGVFQTPTTCETHFTPNVSILDDFVRGYEYVTPGEQYDFNLSDGLIYKVFISDDSGFSDTYSYTIDHNSKLGTGAIVNAVYDDGCSDVTITNGGQGFSNGTIARIFDEDSIATPAVCAVTTGDGSVGSVDITNGGAGYNGFWRIHLPDIGGLGAHTHTIEVSQAEVNQIKSGSPITKTTLDAGHTHDVTMSWNSFVEEFNFDTYDVVADHQHGAISSSHDINPDIQLQLIGDGANAAGYIVLDESGSVVDIIITNSGIGYTTLTVQTLGGASSTDATLSGNLVNGAVVSINVNTPGAGYADSTAEIINIGITSSLFNPSEFTAHVGDTIRFTNNDAAAHTVENVEGAFISPSLPQSATWDYVITKDTDITDIYNLTGSGIAQDGIMYVRENTTFIDIVSSTGGGVRAKGTINAAGTLTNVAIIEKGFGYANTDTVRVIDVSGVGEGAYATANIDRKVINITIDNGGTGYGADTKIFVVDPSGRDVNGTKVFGSGAVVTPTIDASGTITAITVDSQGSGYTDVDFIVHDVAGLGAGLVLTPKVDSYVESVTMTARGTGYVNPICIVSDTVGSYGNGNDAGNSTQSNVAGNLFTATAVLNDGIGAVVVVDGWKDYVSGTQRVTIVDIDPNPTGFGATATASLNAGGAVSGITITNSGTSYKQPQVTVDGEVLYFGAVINTVNNDIALYGPEGNTNASPFAANGVSDTNFKNGVMIQFANDGGHSINDSWTFKLQTWKEGTPATLTYKTYQHDGALINTQGSISLLDKWQVVV
jgi:plastocyanin